MRDFQISIKVWDSDLFISNYEKDIKALGLESRSLHIHTTPEEIFSFTKGHCKCYELLHDTCSTAPNIANTCKPKVEEQTDWALVAIVSIKAIINLIVHIWFCRRRNFI